MKNPNDKPNLNLKMVQLGDFDSVEEVAGYMLDNQILVAECTVNGEFCIVNWMSDLKTYQNAQP